MYVEIPFGIMAIGKSPERSTAVGLEFVPGLGAHLRQLRLGAGLRITELAHVMGRKLGFHQRLSRLESGKLKRPSLRLVADYLRACRASFADTLPMLGRYAGQGRTGEG